MVVEETRTHSKRAGTFDAATTLEGDLRRFLSPMLRRAADRSIAPGTAAPDMYPLGVG